MATYTTNLNLKKPAGSENVSIGDINTNMDTIDSAVGTLNDQIATRPKALYVYYSPTTGVTANTPIDITSEVDLPSGAIVRGISVQCVYGGSNADYNATVIYNASTNKFMLNPTITQTPIRAYFTVFYTN